MSFRIHPEPVVSLLPLIKSHPIVAVQQEEKKVVPAIIEPEVVALVQIPEIQEAEEENEEHEQPQQIFFPPAGVQEQPEVVFRIKRRNAPGNVRSSK